MTVPASVYDLETLAAILTGRGETPDESYSCRCCKRTGTPEGFVSTEGLGGDLPAFACHTCASGPHRIARAAYEAAQVAADAAEGVFDWSSARAVRDALLRACDWTQMADSPLDEPARAAWALYRQALRDITATSASPDTVAWPSPPS